MLMVRHAIGSRLLCQTEEYTIEEVGGLWKITFPVDIETSSNVLAFKGELNIFEVRENEKAWYYSSDAQIDYQPEERRIVILADHKTVYPV